MNYSVILYSRLRCILCIVISISWCVAVNEISLATRNSSVHRFGHLRHIWYDTLPYCVFPQYTHDTRIYVIYTIFTQFIGWTNYGLCAIRLFFMNTYTHTSTRILFCSCKKALIQPKSYENFRFHSQTYTHFFYFLLVFSHSYIALNTQLRSHRKPKKMNAEKITFLFSRFVCVYRWLSLFLGGNFSCIFAPINKLITSK